MGLGVRLLGATWPAWLWRKRVVEKRNSAEQNKEMLLGCFDWEMRGKKVVGLLLICKEQREEWDCFVDGFWWRPGRKERKDLE